MQLHISFLGKGHNQIRGHHGSDCMVGGFTATYAISANHH